MASSSISSPHLGNSLNVETQNLFSQSEQPPHHETGGWDIFLSHSGEQKGFVKGLYTMLSPPYNVFFDITRLSLPLGDDFPHHIFHAVKTCKLALVVLSDKFFSSKWPMLELSAFIDAMPSSEVKVLLLFYELSPNDLKDSRKLQKWHEEWEGFASKDDRIKVSSWSHALRKLGPINSLVFRKSDGELAFLEEIMLAVYELVPLPLKFSHNAIRGRDRLCKVFIDKFEELERRPHSSYPNLSNTYLLGVYGLLGSGKTTLCACLHDRFLSTFAGRALHLKLPSDPTSGDLLEHAKQLFKLTDFGRNRVELLSRLEDLAEVFYVLHANNLQNSRVFLVIDNITSQYSIELVETILHLGVGAGSRVMLVARTLDILHPLLNISKCRNGCIRYVCDTMRVPSINTKEAIDILIRPVGGLGLAPNDSSTLEEKYRARHREIITHVARMCLFRNQGVHDWHSDWLYLPLALTIIGSQLRSTGMDLEKWERRLSQLDTMVKEFKEDAVRKIVEDIYENLPHKLKLTFLDVALFLLPYHTPDYVKYEEAVKLLSFMHECNPETIRRQVKELEKLCFLDLGFRSGHQIIIAQDFFLGFANSLANASSMYHCRRSATGDAQEVTLDLRRQVRKSIAGLRALILEVDAKGRFDFPEGLSSVKAVVVRNCKSLTALGLASLTSLVSLYVEECPNLRYVEFDQSHTYTLKSVKWSCKGEQLQSCSLVQSLLHDRAGKASQVKQLVKRGWCSLSDWGRYWHQRPMNGLMNLAGRLKALQALRLQGTGITNLGDLSNYWPQLRVLAVLEDHLEELELGNLPHLKQFIFGDEKDLCTYTNWHLYKYRWSERRRRARIARKPKLLAGCPELEDVCICSPSCEDGMGSLIIPSPNLRTLWLGDIFCGESVLPNFSASAHSLEEIRVRDHRVLQRIDFAHQFLRLARMELIGCNSLAEITGLECLPNLKDLDIGYCSQLQAVQNLEGVRMLEKLELMYCPVLILTSRSLSMLQSLAKVYVLSCPNVQIGTSDLEDLAALRHLRCTVYGNTLKLKNLVILERLQLVWEICEVQADKPVSLCGSSGDRKCEHVNENAQLQSMQYVPLFVLGESVPAHLCCLELSDVQNLVCLHGVHRLLTLSSLDLHSLPQLTCLQGLECLTNLYCLSIGDCTAVEKLPSLCTLVNMRRLSITNCVNLKVLEGCDKLGLLESAYFEGLESLDHCPIAVERSAQSGPYLRFQRCKFASIKVMVGWLLNEKVSARVWTASVNAFVWELTDHLLEKPRERMAFAEQLVEIVGVYCTSTLPGLTHDYFFDFEPWVEELNFIWWRHCEWKPKSRPSFPRGLERLMEGLGRVPLKAVLQQCQSDAHFRASVAHCLLETDSGVLCEWIWGLVNEYAWWLYEC